MLRSAVRIREVALFFLYADSCGPAKGYGKKDFSHVFRIGKGNIKGKVALPLKERKRRVGGSNPRGGSLQYQRFPLFSVLALFPRVFIKCPPEMRNGLSIPSDKMGKDAPLVSCQEVLLRLFFVKYILPLGSAPIVHNSAFSRRVKGSR